MKLHRQALNALCVAAAMLLAGTACAAPQKLRMTIPVHALAFYSIYVAQDKGLFAAQDIDMEVIATQGDGPDVDALISGSVDFTTSTPNRLLTAYAQGRPLKAVMSVVNRFTNFCYIGKAAAEKVGFRADQSVDEKLRRLKGLTIGGTRPGAMTFLLGMQYLKRAGLEPQRDAKVIGVGGGPALLAALENGQIDVACFASPGVEQAVERGKSLVFINNPRGEDQQLREFLFELLYVRPDFAQKNPEQVRRVVKALVAANQWIQRATDAEHLALLKPRFPGMDDAVLLKAVHNSVAAIEPSGRITPAALASAVKFLRDLQLLDRDVPFDAVVDNSFLPTN
ncbi:ABC transporter substrate-binding protein [Ramlibacter sp.]|uniref:ABC transporter substrate-binding protein n=1 Tax=Ramlibacter sp. TaxID=1917967 RepID=UPI001802C900|nr:ABC transporter substrate-binding protein [Ramlibacter sp.]MBA2672613.1 ABC transporter substrate-binding protein [Ramlibacter sp.]